MFKKFEDKENVSGVNNVKSSVQRGIRAAVLEEFPFVEDYLDQILPKKDAMKVVKCHEHIEIIASSSGEFLFFRQRDGPYYPTLKLLHKYPFILPHMQVDKGAIRFVLSGANIMCPGLTSPGAKMTKVDKDQIVAIMAEGKSNALAIGHTKMSSEEIQAIMAEGKSNALAIGHTKMSSEEIYSKNKGIGVDNIHYLNDGLWNMKPVK